MTVHNRCETTENFLRSLRLQAEHGFDLSLFITDDGSTDGTSAAVARLQPDATVLRGDGSLYWAGGMRKALEAARRDGPDVILLINDDIVLDADALARLHEAHSSHAEAILVGSMRDSDGRSTSYGGFRCRQANGLKMERVEPTDSLIAADTFNANFVLVPGRVMEQLDGFETAFSHALADVDFGLRARRLGVPAYILPGHIGTCAINRRSVLDGAASLGVHQFWARLTSPKNLPPREWFLMTRRHGGPLWFLSAIGVYIKTLARYFHLRLTGSGRGAAG